MKTLKETFDDVCDKQGECPSPEVDISCGTCMIKAVREWLQQERKPQYSGTYLINREQIAVIDDLLKELDSYGNK